MKTIKSKTRISKVIPALALRYACAGLIYFLVLLSRLGTGIFAFVLAEAFLILLFTPGIVCDAFVSSAGRRDFYDLALTRFSFRDIVIRKLAGANFYNCIVIVLSALVICIITLLRRKLNINFLYANLSLIILALASSAIGLASSLLFHRNILASNILAYTLILMLTCSVIIFCPVIERTQHPGIRNIATKIALYSSPVIMVSRSIGKIDIMRTEYMYDLADPIVGRGFAYPDWRAIGGIYFISSLFLMFPAFILQRFFWIGRFED